MKVDSPVMSHEEYQEEEELRQQDSQNYRNDSFDDDDFDHDPKKDEDSDLKPVLPLYKQREKIYE